MEGNLESVLTSQTGRYLIGCFYCSFINSACSYSANPIRIQPIFMSIIFHHYKQLIRTLLQKSVTGKTFVMVGYEYEERFKEIVCFILFLTTFYLHLQRNVIYIRETL